MSACMTGTEKAAASLRTGWTTGACAAAAAKAAAHNLCGGVEVSVVEVPMPDGRRVSFPVCEQSCGGAWCRASVRKSAGDDPDVTDQARVVVTVSFCEGGDIRFVAGDGVGTVCKPGLSILPGEPAINPVPREMIRRAVREVTDKPLVIEISVPGGREMALKTFNPKLGIEGGISILGTTGVVRPFSVPAVKAALACSLDVAEASGVRSLVLVPGNIGERAARRQFRVSDEQVVHAGNEWGYILEETGRRGFGRVLILGHPGKLGKLVCGEWDTHSSRSRDALQVVARMMGDDARTCGQTTVEGLFASLSKAEKAEVGGRLACEILKAIENSFGFRGKWSVVLVNLAGEILGSAGELEAWR